ncbi:MAG: hypothetical protein DSZ23_03815, partial [Thermodesulfatator sp.]
EKLSWEDVKISGRFQDRRLILKGIENSIRILENRQEKEAFFLYGSPIPRKALLLSLERLKDLFRVQNSPHVIMTVLQEEFTPYEIINGNRPEKQPVLATGYFQPVFRGSLNATREYAFPVYAWPPGLIKVRLRLFDRSLPSKAIYGRTAGRQLVPYYSRKEIEEQGLLGPDLALCWLASPVDVLELQIQGSGIINLPGGRSKFIHYAASNGRPYVSVGKVLKQQGLISPENLNWPGIRQWAEDHPEEFRKALYENPRYIFFKWEDKGPVGCFGQVLVPGTSVALDRSVYPPGMPGILILKWPETAKGPDWFTPRPEALVVFNHDTGNAIRGPGRLDLFCGNGTNAGRLAGILKNPSRLIILLHRDAEIPTASKSQTTES